MKNISMFGKATVVSALLAIIIPAPLQAQTRFPAPVIRRPAPVVRAPVINPVGQVTIRGITYNDHTANTAMTPTVVRGGGFFVITCRSLLFTGPTRYDIRVIIQDTALPPNSGGVTAYRLTNVTALGNTLTAQAPNLPVLRGRSYHVTVFLIGPQPMHYAYAGVLQVQ